MFKMTMLLLAMFPLTNLFASPLSSDPDKVGLQVHCNPEEALSEILAGNNVAVKINRFPEAEYEFMTSVDKIDSVNYSGKEIYFKSIDVPKVHDINLCRIKHKVVLVYGEILEDNRISSGIYAPIKFLLPKVTDMYAIARKVIENGSDLNGFLIFEPASSSYKQ